MANILVQLKVDFRTNSLQNNDHIIMKAAALWPWASASTTSAAGTGGWSSVLLSGRPILLRGWRM